VLKSGEEGKRRRKADDFLHGHFKGAVEKRSIDEKRDIHGKLSEQKEQKG